MKLHQEVATDLRVTHLMGIKEYIWVVAVALHLIEALIEVKVHQNVATDIQLTHLMGI